MDIETFFQNQNNKKQLKILTCGSVDDGKSTLIGRLLFDSKNIFSDQLSQTKIESERYGTQGKQIDLALLIDGLQAEREQGITIDVAYRFFSTEKRTTPLKPSIQRLGAQTTIKLFLSIKFPFDSDL